MKHRTAVCPSCGGPVEFKTGSSLVTICEFCQTAVGRGDRDVEDYGKVAEVGDPDSGLTRGMEGKWKGKTFTIVGRVRYRHAGGGSWDEWYLSFPGEGWGWLAEAQGSFSLTVQRRLSAKARLPDFESIEVGSEVPLKGTPLTVREKGIATAEGAEGEIPWKFIPGDKHYYADLYGEDGAVATFEYGDGTADATQSAFLGQTVTLEQLAIDTSSLDPNAGQITVDALQLNCPQCGGQLALRAPDQSLRIACPNCTSLLDASDGKLKLFQTLHQERVVPQIPLGSEGSFGDTKFMVIGFMERYAKYEGRIYPWTEYLLHNADVGFRWLVCSDGHWSVVGPVKEPPKIAGDTAVYDGERFRIYDRGTAYVRYVIGEFYWRVTVGEQARTSDYICPPRMLSYEKSGYGDTEEVNVSIGYHITPEEIEQTFGVNDLRRPWGVGPIQPRPDVGGGRIFSIWIGLIGYLLLVAFFLGGTKTDVWLFIYAAIAVSIFPIGLYFYLHSFEVQRWSDSDYSPYASSD